MGAHDSLASAAATKYRVTVKETLQNLTRPDKDVRRNLGCFGVLVVVVATQVKKVVVQDGDDDDQEIVAVRMVAEENVHRMRNRGTVLGGCGVLAAQVENIKFLLPNFHQKEGDDTTVRQNLIIIGMIHPKKKIKVQWGGIHPRHMVECDVQKVAPEVAVWVAVVVEENVHRMLTPDEKVSVTSQVQEGKVSATNQAVEAPVADTLELTEEHA